MSSDAGSNTTAGGRRSVSCTVRWEAMAGRAARRCADRADRAGRRERESEGADAGGRVGGRDELRAHPQPTPDSGERTGALAAIGALDAAYEMLHGRAGTLVRPDLPVAG
ncbi:hypothetical protein TUSST3_13170 [Streptomyces sp. TUS-ST3]|nr:hypothetical protein TUSST3_13170 [Streptomyces sp. TUS-ST3]